MIKVTENLRILAAEASAAQHLAVDAGAIDVLLYELRRKFAWVVVDLPRGVSPMQRVVLAAASHVVVFCERSLAGLRDTIRLQTLMREQAPQARLWLVEAGATGERAAIGKSEFEKAIGKSLDASLSYDPKVGRRGGQFRPAAAGRGAAQRGRARTAAADAPYWPGRRQPRRNAESLRSARMVAFFKRPAAEDGARRPHRRAFGARAATPV